MATDAEIPELVNQQPCIMCKKPGSKTCSRCHLAKYCSKKCQRADFKLHKQFCHVANESQPSPDHRRALFFEGGDKPARLIWIPVKTVEADDEDEEPSFEQFDTKTYFPDGSDRFQSLRNWRQDGKYYELGPDAADGDGEMFQIYMPRNVFSFAPNQGVAKFSSTGECAGNMRGPILVMRQVSMDDDKYLDMEMRHIRHAADLFAVAFLPGDPTQGGF